MKKIKYLHFAILLILNLAISSCQKDLAVETSISSGSLAKDASGDCAPTLLNGSYVVNQILTVNDYMEVQVGFSNIGSYDIKTDTVNGYYFKAEGTVGVTGLSTIRLQGTGKPLVPGIDIFTVRFGISACEVNIAAISNAGVSLPVLTTTAINSITGNTAVSGGNILSNGGSTIVTRGVCWSTLPSPTVSGNFTNDGSGIGLFTSNITGLAAGTTYYVRAYATNTTGIGYGNEISFLTTSLSTANVYVAGFESNGTNGIAKIWKNGVETILSNGVNDASADGVFVSGSDVYASGNETGAQRIAKTWKNAVPTTLLAGPLFIAQARSIYVSGVDVYVAGYSNNVTGSGTVWKNGVATSLANGSPFAITDALGVFVSGSNIYAAGWGRNGGNMVAAIWKNGISSSLTNGSENALAFSVFVSGTDVYACGWEKSGTATVAKIWKNGVVTALPSNSTFAIARAVFVVGSDVYAVGSDGTAAVVWKNGLRTALTNGANFANANSVYVLAGDVYVAGTESNGTNDVAKVWKNGVATSLTSGANDSDARSIFVQ